MTRFLDHCTGEFFGYEDDEMTDFEAKCEQAARELRTWQGGRDSIMQRDLENAVNLLTQAAELHKTFKAKTVALWALLDDIDTADDMAKGDCETYRQIVQRIQHKRFAIMSGEEWDAARSEK